MKVDQCRWTASEGWDPHPPGGLELSPQLVMVFANPDRLRDDERLNEVREAYPDAFVFGCSTAGEIRQTDVTEDGMVVTALAFERSKIQKAMAVIGDEDSFAAPSISRWGPPSESVLRGPCASWDSWTRGRYTARHVADKPVQTDDLDWQSTSC